MESPKHLPTKAVIDLGTNTILMVVGRRLLDGRIEILDDAHAIARLGKGVDAQRRILPETINRVCGFLLDYKKRAHSHGARQITAYGTSALRDAANKEELIEVVKIRTGIDLVEIPGSEEARLAFSGAGFGLELPERYGVLDIGGGSTELAIGAGNRIEQSTSVDIGAVRVTERCFGPLPPSPAQQADAAAVIQRELSLLLPYPVGTPLVGVAGTATTLGAVAKGTGDCNAEELNGHFLSRDRVEELAACLLTLNLDGIRTIPQIHPQRADIITAGALILAQALRLFACPGLTVSTRGIRYGLLLRVLRQN